MRRRNRRTCETHFPPIEPCLPNSTLRSKFPVLNGHSHAIDSNDTDVMWRCVQVGLLFTKRPREEVTKYFESFSVADHATAGFVPKETIVLPKGSLGTWPVSMMDQFRRLGVIVEVEDAELVNRQELNMCTAGQPITPEGAKLLVRRGVPRSFLVAHSTREQLG